MFFNTAQNVVNFTWYDFFPIVLITLFSCSVHLYCVKQGIFSLPSFPPPPTCACCALECFTNRIIPFMQAITGDAVHLKFEKARRALEDSLRRVVDIVPQSIGCQVIISLSCSSFIFPFTIHG